MQRNVVLYWTGKEYKFIKILREFIYKFSSYGKGYKVYFLTPQNVKEYIDIHPAFFGLQPAHQADYVRVNFLYKYGGIWLDSDTLVMEPLDSLFDIFNNYDGFFIKQGGTELCNGVFSSKANTILLKEWKEHIDTIMNRKGSSLHWTEIGNSWLNNEPQNKTSLINYKIFSGVNDIYPINWHLCVQEYLNKPYDNYKTIVREYQPLIVLVNSVYKELEKLSIDEIMNGNRPINYFIDKAQSNLNFNKNKLFNDLWIYNYGKHDYISNSIINHKCWEPNITNIFNCILKEGVECVIDVGCNIGYYSIISSPYAKQVFSIDGNVKNIQLLNATLICNNISNINLIYKCIADKETLYEPTNTELINKCGNIGGLSFNESKSNNGIQTITLDQIIEKNNIKKIDLMKIDIEGGELKALKGCKNALKMGKIKNIIIEISPCFNNDSNEILLILQNNGYTLFNIPHQEVGNYKNDKNYLSNITKEQYVIKNIDNFLKRINRQTNIIAML